MRRMQKPSLLISLLLLFSHSLFSQSATDRLNELELRLTRAAGHERISLMQDLADARFLAGDLQEASDMYRLLWQETGSGGDLYRLKYYQLQYEMGNWDILREISSLSVNPSVPERLSYLELEIRLLMSMGYWEEAGELIDSNREWMDNQVSLLYLSWYYYSILSDRVSMEKFKNPILLRFPQSPEALIVKGVAEERIQPSLLMMGLKPRVERFYYQIGAFKEEGSAEELIEKMTSQGYSSEILIDSGWYKVLLPISKPQAEEMLTTLTSLGLKPFRVNF